MPSKIEHDATWQGYPRLTCRRTECKEKTLVRQPYMTDNEWKRAVKTFEDVHLHLKEKTANTVQ